MDISSQVLKICPHGMEVPKMYPKFGHILNAIYTRLNDNFVVQTIGKCPKYDHNVPKVTIMDVFFMFILLESTRIRMAPMDALGQPMQMC